MSLSVTATPEIDINQISFDDDCDLGLLDKHSPLSPVCKKQLAMINAMIELNYLAVDNSELKLTLPGIEYMKNNYQKFLNNLSNSDPDMKNIMEGFSGFSFGSILMSQIEKFQRQNCLINLDDENNDDNVKFNNKAEGDIIW
jgi:hypothetical protein